MDKLKPCPFCGSQPWIQHDDVLLGWFIHCHNCTGTVAAYTKEQAIEAWNRRAGNGT